MAKDESAASDNLDALIVRNLRDLEAATHRFFHHTETRVAKAIDEMVEVWSKTNGWKGQFDWKEEGLWVAPQRWMSDSSDEGDRLAYFELDAGLGDDFDYNENEDVFWLTRLCQQGRGKIGFRWRYGTALGISKPKWKKLIQSDDGKRAERIYKLGFEPEDSGLFFTQIKVETEQLAVGFIEGSLEKALQPIQLGLDRLLTSIPEFDAALKAAKNLS
jgi:hypothetical protein